MNQSRTALLTLTLISPLACTAAFSQQSTQTPVTPGEATQSQPAPTKPTAYDISHPGGRDIEDLNLRGAYLKLPPFTDTLSGEANPVRQGLAKRGVGVARFGDTTFTYNTLSPPVPLADQTYLGQRPTWKTSHYFMLTWDLRQLHVRGGQLEILGTLQRISWNPGGPNATQFGAIAYYQSLFHNRLELKGGYLDNDFEFVGTAIGGQASSGSLGVFASLPFEVGMSYLPLTAPGLNVNIHYPKDFYTKFGFQRSDDPKGGVTEANRNAIGLRFKPHGDGLLTIYEGGYKHAAAKDSKEMWIRAGYMYNTSHFANAKTGGMSTNNDLFYLLGDRQLTQPDRAKPYRGLYGGFSAMYAPPAQNAYTQYYEARGYFLGPFESRPSDLISVVTSHTDYSEYTTRNLAATGQSAWNSSTSLTGSYNARLFRGFYFSPGLSYTHGPAITPRAKSSLSVLGQINVFF